MDSFVEEKLIEWGLEKFIPKFQENEIDRESFTLLDEETMKEIIKPIGPRLKLKKEIQKMVKALKMPENDSDVTLEDVGLDDCSLDSDAPSPKASTSSSQSSQLASKGMPAPKETRSPNSTCSRSPSPSPSARKKARTDFNIREIIGTLKGDGDVLIEEMEAGLLSYKSRKRVVNVLVSHLIENYGKFPRTDVKLAMAKAITTEFPRLENRDGEGYQVWFTPAIGKHDSSGFLENRLRNVRRRDPDKTPFESPPSSSSASSRLVSTVNLDISSNELEDGDIAAMTTWLKYHNSPREQVEEMMLKTCKARAAYIRSEKERSAGEILREYPRLIDTPGMIDQDFRILFPSASDALFMQWPNCFEKIITYAEKQVDWKQLLHFSGNLETDDQKSNAAIHILPLLFPPGMKRKEGRKGPSKHATSDDARTSFIQVEKIGTNIPAFLEAVKKTQPFLLALGKQEDPEQVFVIIERQTVACSSLLKGLDLCFKLFYILDIDYPWECQNLWDFIQKFIYGLGKGKGREKSVPSVSLLINFLTPSKAS